MPAPHPRSQGSTGTDATAERGRGVPLSGTDDDFGLASHRVADGSGPTSGPVPGSAVAELAPGTDLGGVTIVRLLAEGGMGRVYEGRQHAPARPVAVKVMREGLDTAALVRRFEFEAQVLARLHHPHVAQIHTFGTFESVRGVVPFFVMEFVADAQSITGFAASRGLDARERVTLFRPVCDAVGHGHRMGVVHRDLKPGNILVAGSGEAKVIDFGVARSTEADRAAATAATRAGDVVGTLRYMSPEQLGLEEVAVDARADVYALGLVLHELLAGELPYDLRGRTPVEAACLLAARGVDRPADVARRFRRQGADPRTASQLAVIVATCLEPRPADRYATAGDLEADLRRWLSGEPIRARPPTLADSLRRLVRRHRAATLAAATALGALLAAVGGIAWFSLRADTQRREALAARRAADERTIEARRQLYRASLMLAGEARDRGNVSEARRLLDQAAGLADASGPGRAVEIGCLAASLDDAIAVIDAGGTALRAVAVSPRGESVAAGDRDGGIRVWRRGLDGAESWSGAAPVELRGHTGPVWSLAFSPDGTGLASASTDGSVRIWDPAGGGERRRLEGHSAAVYAATYSRDGSFLATASADRTLRIHDTATWQTRLVLRGHDATVFAASFAPDGSRIATASRDHTTRLWRLADGEPLTTLRGHAAAVLDVAHSPDGVLLVTGSEDATARVWDAASGREVAVLRHPPRVNGVAFVDADRLVTAGGDGIVRCWDARRGSEIEAFRGHAAAAWALDVAAEPGLAATGSDDATVRLWDLATGGTSVLRGGGRLLAAEFSEDGRWLAVGDADGAVHVHDAGTFRERVTLEAGAGRIGGVAFSADGGQLAAACEDGAVRTWRSGAFQPAGTIPVHERRAYSVDWAADAGRIVTAAEDRTARIVDLAGGAETLVLRHPGRVFCAVFSPDGASVATACEDRRARLWDARDGSTLAVFSGHDGPVNWVVFSPDGRRLATASSDGRVRTWNVDGGDPRLVMTGPARQVWRVAYTPDGTRLAAASADGTAQLWDAESGAPLLMLRGHRDQVWGLAFAPTGEAIATASWDGTARLWGVPAAEIARRRQREGNPAAGRD